MAYWSLQHKKEVSSSKYLWFCSFSLSSTSVLELKWAQKIDFLCFSFFLLSINFSPYESFFYFFISTLGGKRFTLYNIVHTIRLGWKLIAVTRWKHTELFPGWNLTPVKSPGGEISSLHGWFHRGNFTPGRNFMCDGGLSNFQSLLFILKQISKTNFRHLSLHEWLVFASFASCNKHFLAFLDKNLLRNNLQRKDFTEILVAHKRNFLNSCLLSGHTLFRNIREKKYVKEIWRH